MTRIAVTAEQIAGMPDLPSMQEPEVETPAPNTDAAGAVIPDPKAAKLTDAEAKAAAAKAEADKVAAAAKGDDDVIGAEKLNAINRAAKRSRDELATERAAFDAEKAKSEPLIAAGKEYERLKASLASGGDRAVSALLAHLGVKRTKALADGLYWDAEDLDDKDKAHAKYAARRTTSVVDTKVADLERQNAELAAKFAAKEQAEQDAALRAGAVKQITEAIDAKTMPYVAKALASKKSVDHQDALFDMGRMMAKRDGALPTVAALLKEYDTYLREEIEIFNEPKTEVPNPGAGESKAANKTLTSDLTTTTPGRSKGGKKSREELVKEALKGMPDPSIRED